jgi:hypothetical protein
MKVRIEIDADVDESAARATGPLMRILRIMSGQVPYQVKWYQENKERILAEDKERRRVASEAKKEVVVKQVVDIQTKRAERAAYERERRAKRRAEKAHDKAQAKAAKNAVVAPENMVHPVPPPDNILRFP